MPRPALAAAFAATLVVALAVWFAAPRAAVADVEADDVRTAASIEAILADPALPRAFWGITVVDVASGRVIASRNADLNLMPASTLKLVTTAAALDALGPDFRYTTTLHHVGPEARGGTLSGDLVLRGAGDPSFGSSDHGDPLARWAEQLAGAGVRRITGRLVGDDDRFEDALWAEGWDVRHVATESYAAPTGGLAWADNVLPLRISGGRATGGPRGFATVERVRGGSRMRVERILGTDTYRLSGQVASGYSGTMNVPVGNPTLYALHAFADRLREAGIDVSDLRLWDIDDLPSPPSVPDGAAPLLVHVSPPLSALARRINHESDNLYAEHVFRTLVPDGSTDAAARRVTSFLEAAGADTDGIAIRDGSGLSRKNYLTPNAMAALLRHMARHRHAAAFRATLPAGGESGSTLRSRLAGAGVRAKTGSLDAVRCLAGYVDAPGGPAVFVLMANHYTVNGSRIADAQDRIVRAISSGGRADLEDGIE